MKGILRYGVIVMFLAVSHPIYALEDLVPYDDFPAKLVDPNKWFGFETLGYGVEVTRVIKRKQLDMSYRSYGLPTTDTGAIPSFLSLIFTNFAAVTGIESTVRVSRFETLACASNTEPPYTAAGLFGNFFNTAAPVPGSREHDVGAEIDIQRSPDLVGSNLLRVVAYALECNDATCTNRTFLGFEDLGTIPKGKTARLRMQWDPDNDRFIFQRDDLPEVFLPYSVSDTAPASNAAKGLNVLHVVPNCTTAPRPVGFIEASFDDVSVNASAAP